LCASSEIRFAFAKGVFRRTALRLLKKESSLTVGMKKKRLSAGLGESHLDKALAGK
jgi:hypothetical protein